MLYCFLKLKKSIIIASFVLSEENEKISLGNHMGKFSSK